MQGVSNFGALTEWDNARNESEVVNIECGNGILRCKSLRSEGCDNEEGEVGFHNVRTSQVREKEGAPLQKPDNRVDQVGEENSKDKNQEFASGSVENCEHEGKEKDGEEDIRSSLPRLTEGCQRVTNSNSRRRH